MSPTLETERPYHHGDLRVALVDAGLQLTREGGLEALRLREVTRHVGVSPNAAYRHFTNRRALIDAVADRIQEMMADRMLAHREADKKVPQIRASDELRAAGLGYIDFAIAEPGWFSVAFFRPPDEAPATPGQTPPFRLLVEALDAMVEASVLGESAREGAEWHCWSTVHGFAELATRGPLRAMPAAEVKGLAERTVEAIITGISWSPWARPTSRGGGL